MQFRKIRELEYVYGDENRIMKILNSAKEPILIKIKDFPDTFNLDYFAEYIKAPTAYSVFENHLLLGHRIDDFSKVIQEIKGNKPYRIFGQLLPRNQSAIIEYNVPLWQKIPYRPRYFKDIIKVAYFFGGKDSHTGMHFDREHCCNLHLCLSGKKELILFTEDQSDKLYKVPFVGDTLIEFGLPMEEIDKKFPRSRDAVGYKVTIEKGDMVFMPRNCWHYTSYLDAAGSATYSFYPLKFFQYYGLVTGHFYQGYKDGYGFKLHNKTFFKKFSDNYALATGIKKFFYKGIEKLLYVFMLPLVTSAYLIRIRLRRMKKVNY